MAIRSWMMACLGVAILAFSLGRSGIGAAQNIDRPIKPVTIARPVAPSFKNSEVARPPAIQPPRLLASPVLAADQKAANVANRSATAAEFSSNPFPTQLGQRVAATSKLEKQLHVLFPEAKVYLISLANRVVIKGNVRDAEEAARIVQIVRSGLNTYFLDDKPAPSSRFQQVSAVQPGEVIVDQLRFPQLSVKLKVKVVELDPKKIRELGIDVASLSRGTGPAAFERSPANAKLPYGLFENSVADGFITGLIKAKVAKIIGEPILRPKSGHKAVFLAGSESLVPTTTGSEGTPTWIRHRDARITVTPSIIDKDSFKLDVIPEFSRRSKVNEVQGIPDIGRRRATTTVKMRAGQSFVSALFYNKSLGDDFAQSSFLSELPVWVGRDSESKTVLVVITPEIAEPSVPAESSKPPGVLAAQSLASGACQNPPVDTGIDSVPQPCRVANEVRRSSVTPSEWGSGDQPHDFSDTRQQWASIPQNLEWSNFAPPPRLTHLESALSSLIAAGLTKEAAIVRQEIVKEKQARQLAQLEEKKLELAALQAEIEALKKTLPPSDAKSPTQFRLNTLILSSTEDRFRAEGLEFDHDTGSDKATNDRNLALHLLKNVSNRAKLLEKCKQAPGIGVRGAATHVVVDGQHPTWQHSLEIPVPQFAAANDDSSSQRAIGLRRIGTIISFKPSLNSDGMVDLETGLKISTLENNGGPITQVGGISGPAITSRKGTSTVKLRPRQTAIFGALNPDGTMLVVAVNISVEE
jgi:Flp pilus assembly secretin CpaC